MIIIGKPRLKRGKFASNTTFYTLVRRINLQLPQCIPFYQVVIVDLFKLALYFFLWDQAKLCPLFHMLHSHSTNNHHFNGHSFQIAKSLSLCQYQSVYVPPLVTKIIRSIKTYSYVSCVLANTVPYHSIECY